MVGRVLKLFTGVLAKLPICGRTRKKVPDRMLVDVRITRSHNLNWSRQTKWTLKLSLTTNRLNKLIGNPLLLLDRSGRLEIRIQNTLTESGSISNRFTILGDPAVKTRGLHRVPFLVNRRLVGPPRLWSGSTASPTISLIVIWASDYRNRCPTK